MDNESLVARNTVNEVYQQILADLRRAETLLPSSNGFLARNYVASAQLSRVYLQMQLFADARDAANRVINEASANGKILVSDFMNAFNTDGDSPEDLFSIQVNTQDPDNAMFLFYSLPEFGARDGDVSVQSPHLDYYEEGDDRLSQFFVSAGEIRTAKW